MTEVTEAMNRMKKGKAIRPDDIQVETWRVFGKTDVKWVTTIHRNVMQTEKMPENRIYSTLIPVFKNKGDIQDCKNYRGMKLTPRTLEPESDRQQ